MTIEQILKRVELGHPITRSQLERLERRRAKILDELDRIDLLLPTCYSECARWGKRPNPAIIHR